MLNVIWAALMVAAVVCGIATGRIEQVSNAVFSGASEAVSVWITLLSMLVMWGGMTEIMECSGLSAAIGRALAPLVRRLMPELRDRPKACTAVALSLAANMLGLGNAATPLGLKAMKELHAANGGSAIAGNSMVTFVVLCSVSVQLIPTGVAALRAGCGSASPMAIMPAVWFVSAGALVVGVGLSRLLAGRFTAA